MELLIWPITLYSGDLFITRLFASVTSDTHIDIIEYFCTIVKSFCISDNIPHLDTIEHICIISVGSGFISVGLMESWVDVTISIVMGKLVKIYKIFLVPIFKGKL